MKDVQHQTKRDHLNINLDTILLVFLADDIELCSSHMLEPTSGDVK